MEIVERFAIELQKAAGGWEATGREIDEIIANLCDPNPDVALVELERYLTENGFEIVLVGENRTEEALEEARRLLGYSTHRNEYASLRSLFMEFIRHVSNLTICCLMLRSKGG